MNIQDEGKIRIERFTLLNFLGFIERIGAVDLVDNDLTFQNVVAQNVDFLVLQIFFDLSLAEICNGFNEGIFLFLLGTFLLLLLLLFVLFRLLVCGSINSLQSLS